MAQFRKFIVSPAEVAVEGEVGKCEAWQKAPVKGGPGPNEVPPELEGGRIKGYMLACLLLLQ